MTSLTLKAIHRVKQKDIKTLNLNICLIITSHIIINIQQNYRKLQVFLILCSPSLHVALDATSSKWICLAHQAQTVKLF